MTQNPYAYGKLESNGPTYWGEIHAAPRHDYPCTLLCEEDLCKLLPMGHQYLNIDNALIMLHDCSLQAEVHCYQCLMGRLKQLNKQMEASTNEMHTLIPQKHGCVDRLHKARTM